MRIVRWFFGLLILAALAFGVAYYYAGTLDGPAITINQPSVIGQGGTLDVSVDAPAGELTALNIQLEQKGRTFAILDLASAPAGAVVTEGDRIRVTRPIGKKTLPELTAGPATLRVSASRPVFRRLRQVSSESSRDIQVRLTAPRVAVVSTHHYVNQGGAEMVVYRVSPPDVESAVRVGEVTYPGFPNTAAGLARPGIESRIFRPAVQPVARHADGNRRAGRRGQPDAQSVRASRLSKEVPQQPHSARRQVSRARRARHSAVVAAGPGISRRFVAVVSQDQQRPSAHEQRNDRGAREEDGAIDALGRRVPATRRIADRIGVRRLPHLPLRRQRRRPPGASRLRPCEDRQFTGDRREQRKGGVRLRARHLRQHGDRRSRNGGAIALRAPLFVRRQRRRHCEEGAAAGRERPDRPRRRRSPALQHARERTVRKRNRVVGSALDRGPHHAEVAARP